MQPSSDQRPGEIAVELPPTTDAEIYFIGRIRTPWTSRAETPRNSRAGRIAEARIELDPRWKAGLKDIERCSHLIVLYWLDRSRRDLVVQVPRYLSEPRGVFAIRSPVRPNPIGLSVAELIKVDSTELVIRGIDCLDGTPLIDIKPYYASTDSFPDATRP